LAVKIGRFQLQLSAALLSLPPRHFLTFKAFKNESDAS
jgi:hypothetical protein